MFAHRVKNQLSFREVLDVALPNSTDLSRHVCRITNRR